MFEQKTEIVFNKEVASQTFLMGIRSKEIVAEAKPGQFVMVKVREGLDPLLRRPFSISGIRDQDIVLILYKIVGRGTAILQEKRVGERLSILGPLGQGFVDPENGRTPLLIAGGIGVAPLLFLAQSIKVKNALMFMGFGSSNEIIPVDIMGDFKIQHSISTDDGSHGHSGLVTDLLAMYLEQHPNPQTSLSFFICGPKPMLQQVADMALAYHIPCQVSLESAMACGMGACQGCAVKASPQEGHTYRHICKDGPVFPVDQINWNLI